jgi:phosphonatase-like hydrolase
MVMGWRKIDAVSMLLDQFAAAAFKDNPDMAAGIHDRFTQNMVEFYTRDEQLAPLPFAEELFSILQGQHIKVALNTGFTRVITDVILRRLNWMRSPLIDATVTSDEVPEGRPQPYMIEKIMGQFGISDPAEVVKVGDTEVDIREGRNAGCGLVIGVTTGAYTREQLSNFSPDKIIDSLSELPALIL